MFNKVMFFIIQAYYGHSNNRSEWNNSVGWKKTVKLIIALVGNVSNNSIEWISTNFIMNQLKFYKRIEKIYQNIKFNNNFCLYIFIIQKDTLQYTVTYSFRICYTHNKVNKVYH